MPHVGLGAVQQPLELEAIRVPVRDDVADLADDSREYEDADQVTDYREDVPANQEGRKRADQSEGGVIVRPTVSRRRAAPAGASLLFLSLFFFFHIFLPFLTCLHYVRSLSFFFLHLRLVHFPSPHILSIRSFLHSFVIFLFLSLSFIYSLSLFPFFFTGTRQTDTHTDTHTHTHRGDTCTYTCADLLANNLVSCSLPFDPRRLVKRKER